MSHDTPVRNHRILVTGGAGMIGSHLADLLTGAGAAEVVILDDLSRGRIESLATAKGLGKVTLIRGDIRDRAIVAKAVRDIDVVYHLAAIRLTQCAQEPRLALEVMADGTFNVVEAAVAAGVRRFVAASSASIYGLAEEFPTGESHHPWNNRTIYGAAKMFNEGVYASFREMSGLDYIALRPFNVYGPRMDTKGAYTEVLVRWMERIARGEPPVIFGDGQQSMDFVYVEDVARAFFLAAGARAAGEVYNIASGVETTLRGLAEALLATMGSELGIEFAPERALTAMPRRLADTRKAKAGLGFTAEVDLAEGLRRLVDWWRVSRQAETPVVAEAR